MVSTRCHFEERDSSSVIASPPQANEVPSHGRVPFPATRISVESRGLHESLRTTAHGGKSSRSGTIS